MATVYAESSDGYVNISNSNWVTARDANTGTGVSSSTTRNSFAINASRTAARGGGYSYSVSRAFFSFDTSGISSNVASATLKIYGYSQTVGDIIALKPTSDISSLATADFDAITGWDGASADGSGAGDNESNVTKYSVEIASWSSSGYNDIALTSVGLENMRDDDTVYICLLNYDHDLKDVIPTGYSAHRNGLHFQNYTGTSRDPYIDYTLAPTATDNSVFFGCNF